MSEYKKDNLIVELSVEFSLEIIKYCASLEGMKKYSMAKQLWRSGTAIGALVHESQNAESMADFIHKLKIAGKEAEETKYWLLLCKLSQDHPPVNDLEIKIKTINKILNKIITTSKLKSQSD